MVSNRCIFAVKIIFSSLDIGYSSITLGEAELEEPPTTAQLEELEIQLKKIGLELIKDRKIMLIEKIRKSIIELIFYTEALPNKKYSLLISEKLNYDYTYISNLFKQTKGICIQQYIIVLRIERVKQLLTYSNLSLTDISYEMNYSSVSHLANQFKKITGCTTTYFKQLGTKNLIPIEVL